MRHWCSQLWELESPLPNVWRGFTAPWCLGMLISLHWVRHAYFIYFMYCIPLKKIIWIPIYRVFHTGLEHLGTRSQVSQDLGPRTWGKLREPQDAYMMFEPCVSHCYYHYYSFSANQRSLGSKMILWRGGHIQYNAGAHRLETILSFLWQFCFSSWVYVLLLHQVHQLPAH